MKLNKIKQTLCVLFSVVLTTFIILAPIEVKAEDWEYKCDIDKTTGDATGRIFGPQVTGRVLVTPVKWDMVDITSSFYYSRYKSGYRLYLNFTNLDLLHDSGGGIIENFLMKLRRSMIDAGYITLRQGFMPKNKDMELAEYFYSEKELHFEDDDYILENMKSQKTFIIQLPYRKLGLVTFFYPLMGFQDVLAKMQASCKFK